MKRSVCLIFLALFGGITNHNIITFLEYFLFKLYHNIRHTIIIHLLSVCWDLHGHATYKSEALGSGCPTIILVFTLKLMSYFQVTFFLNSYTVKHLRNDRCTTRFGTKTLDYVFTFSQFLQLLITPR